MIRKRGRGPPVSLVGRLKGNRRGRKVRCRICGRCCVVINWRHMGSHGIGMAEYRRRYPEAATMSEEARYQRGLEAIKITREEILSKISRLCGAGRCVTASDLISSDPGFYQRARYHFGPWHKALTAAGIEAVPGGQAKVRELACRPRRGRCPPATPQEYGPAAFLS